MFYDAAQAGHASDTGFDCLSVATAASISPTRRRLHRQLRADPCSANPTWAGPSTPAPSSTRPTGLPGWSGSPTTAVRRSRRASGPRSSTAPAPGSSPVRAPTRDLLQQHGGLPLGEHGGGSLHGRRSAASSTCSSAGASTPRRATPRASPSAPRRPARARQTDPNPILSSYGSVAGPGGGSLFQDASGNYWLDYGGWTAGCTSYSCGGARRLFVAPRHLAYRLGRAERTGGRDGQHPERQGLLARRLRRRHLHLRRRRVLRLDGRHPPERAHRRHGAHARRQGLLAGGLRRRHLHLRRRQVLRLDRRACISTNRSSAWRRRPTATATGWSPPTAASSPSATPRSTARPAPST